MRSFMGGGIAFMIKINLVTVGKVKEKYFSEAVAEYAKRLSRFCEFKLTEAEEINFVKTPNAAEIKKILSAEGENISKYIKGYIIVFAVEGKKLSSEGFAEKIKNLTDSGEGEITLVIGGSYGIDDKIKEKANFKMSFSDMTFPHTMTRVIAAEQIYRAFTIIAGVGYHK